MEGSTLDLLEDAEDLMFDTGKRLGSCVDLGSSLEIRGEDLTLAKKKHERNEKIYEELMIIRQIWQHSSELQAKFEEVTNEYLGLVKQVKYITKVIFVIDDLEVSSIVVPYSDFVCSRLYSSYSEDSNDWLIPSFTNKDTNP